MGPPDTADLVASLDDPERFAAIFERNHRVVWTYLARLGGRDLDPERGTVRSWLYGIATNLWRTRVRSLVRGGAALRRAEARAGAAAPDPADAVATAVDASDALRQVLSAGARLGDNDREVLVLYAWEQLSYAEIALVLDAPIGTVRSRLARARAHLTELLEPTGQLVGDDPADPWRRP